jgi:hypothetical protein
MNTELINELKAKCIVREMRGTNAFDNYMVNRFDSEKFAELILQDCMSICESLGDKGLDGHYCVDKIRREFGV